MPSKVRMLRNSMLCLTVPPLVAVAAPFQSQIATSILPGRFALSMEDESRSVVTVAIPLPALDATIKQSLAGAGNNSSAPFHVDSDSGFVEFDNQIFAIAYQAHIEGKINAINQGFNCKILIRLGIPSAPLPSVVVQDLNSTVDCSSGAFFNVVSDLSGLLTSYVRSSLSRSILQADDPNNALASLQQTDPELASFISTAYVQGSYCMYSAQIQGLCLKVGWRSSSAIADRMRNLIATAPTATGPIQNVDYDAQIARFKAISHREPSKTNSSYSFPAKYDAGTYDSGDMALFGGLLCMAGEQEGCTLLHNSQDANGRFWRSPNHVGEPGEGSFTGDQINGVFAFLGTTRDSSALTEYLQFIGGNSMGVPPIPVLENAYASCTPDSAQKCTLAGMEWLLFNQLASDLGVSVAVPSDVRDPTTKYGDRFDDLVWPAAFTPRGYTLHLIGVKIAVARLLGYRSAALSDAAAILAAREPENPFFLYLHLGSDAAIINQVKRKCVVDPTRTSFVQWQWERSEIDKDQQQRSPWQTSMGWDCIFIYNLLKNHVPIGP